VRKGVIPHTITSIITAIDSICIDLILCRFRFGRRSLFNANVYPNKKINMGAAIEKIMRIAGIILTPKKQ
jgi:hypothetical protein